MRYAGICQDGRYFLQAAKELSDDWTLMKVGTRPLIKRSVLYRYRAYPQINLFSGRV